MEDDQGFRLLIFVESVVVEAAPIERPVLGFRFASLPPLFVPAPPPLPGLERSRALPAGTVIPFGVGREASFKSNGPLPPYATLQLRLVDEADGRLVGSGVLRLPTGGDAGGDATSGSALAQASSAADVHVGQFVECRVSRSPEAHAQAGLTSAQRHAQQQRAALDAVTSAASVAGLDPERARQPRPQTAAERGAAEGESALVRFRWRLAPDALTGLAPEPARAPPVQPQRLATARQRQQEAEAATAAEIAANAAVAEAVAAAAVELRVPTVHVHADCLVLHGLAAQSAEETLGAEGRRAEARRAAAAAAAPATPATADGGPATANRRLVAPYSAAQQPPPRPPPMAGFVPGVAAVRAPAGPLPDSAGLRFPGAADRGWQSATGADAFGGVRAPAAIAAEPAAGYGCAGSGQPAPLAFVRAAHAGAALPPRWWEEGEGMRPIGTEYAPPQPPPLSFSHAPLAAMCGRAGASQHRAADAGAHGTGARGVPAPFARAEQAAAAEGGLWLSAQPQPVAAGDARGGEAGTASASAPVAGPLWRPSGAEAARAYEAAAAISAPAPPLPWAQKPVLATSRAALAQLSLDLQYMGSRDYAAQLMRRAILDAHPDIARAPRPAVQPGAAAAAVAAVGSGARYPLSCAPEAEAQEGESGEIGGAQTPPGAARRQQRAYASPSPHASRGRTPGPSSRPASARSLHDFGAGTTERHPAAKPRGGPPSPGTSWARLFGKPPPL